MIIQCPEFHLLVAELLPFTQCMLDEHGGFLPVGGYVQSGAAVMLPPFTEATATLQEWLLAVKAALRKQAAGADCAAVAHCGVRPADDSTWRRQPVS